MAKLRRTKFDPASGRDHPATSSSAPSKSRSAWRTSRTTCDANQFTPRADKQYLAFFKPYGVLSQFTSSDAEHKTLAEFGLPKGVYPVGRLDLDSEGLLLLTDDERLNSTLLDPSHGHARTYMAQVENVPNKGSLERLCKGLFIQGRKTLPCQAELLDHEPDLPPREVPIRFRKHIPTAWLKLTLTEGKNRQVRRVTAAIGHPTLRLVRSAIGRLTIDILELEPGQWRPLEKHEIKLLSTKV